MYPAATGGLGAVQEYNGVVLELTSNQQRRSDSHIVDWPTIALIGAFWISLTIVVLAGDALPAPVAVAVLGALGAFYMSLQHEVIHGHPTGRRAVDAALVTIPLGLLLPFPRYRDTHLAHHASDVTNPLDDPESFYVSADAWRRAGPTVRGLLVINRTLAGRLLLGPLILTARTLHHEILLTTRSSYIRWTWARHVVASAVVVAVVHRSPLPLWEFLAGFVYVGSMFTLLRSFVEHRMPVDPAASDLPRAAIVRTGRFFGLLFLNNNLHHTHHRLPGAAWFRLPELTRTSDAEAIAAAGAGSYAGYTAIARMYMFRPFEQPVHPSSDIIGA